VATSTGGHGNRLAPPPALTSSTFHDLKHSGNTLAASTGASLKEQTARVGNASARAALIYQHATQPSGTGP
jgi:hypothetical protein